MMIAYLLVLALALMLLSAVSITLVAIWVYRDAKSRGLEAWVWTLVTVLVPSFIGLLLYFLVGRKEIHRPCSACGKQVPRRSTFCGYCGAQMPPEAECPAAKPVGKGLLISGLVCTVVVIVLGFGSIIGLALADGGASPDIFSVSTIYVENNWGDKWSVSYHYTNKSPDHSFRIKDDGPQALHFEGKCEEGPLTLRVWQGDIERAFDLTGGQTVKDSLDLSIFAPGKVYLELNNNRGEGKMVEFNAWWDNSVPPSVSAVPPVAEGNPAIMADAETLISSWTPWV